MNTKRPEDLADRLVRDGLLTRYQAACLLQGKGQQLSIADYRVLQPDVDAETDRCLVCRDRSERRVVLRLLPRMRRDDPMTLAQFYCEVTAAAGLDHPNFARVFPPIRHGDSHYQRTEYVVGETLQTLVKREGPLTLDRALGYMHLAAMGMAHAHAAGVAHRDLRPANLLVNRTAAVKVRNIGLARFFHAEERVLAHIDGGAVDYLAPE
jgi:serine/threonine-protein kinase